MPTIVDPKLTPAQILIYDAIREGITRHNLCPSQGEIRRALQCSTTTIMNALRVLENKGHITRERFSPRGIQLVDPERKLAKYPVAPWDEDADTPLIWDDI